MKLLVLGGTVFLGRHVVDAALARGDEVTLFNRGQTNPDLFPEVERLAGDRDGGLDELEGRQWDAVIDTSGYVPRVVGASARLLADSVSHYTFVSSISVYAGFATAGMDESAPIARIADESVEDVAANYGALKALCEKAAEAAMPGRVLNVRAGLIVGPHDPTDRFTYWPSRIARGGDVLAPGPASRQVQVVDARDLADWMLRMAESATPGTFNATGPEYELSMGRLLEDCQEAGGRAARLVWVDDAFLLEHGVTPWTELPLWVPDTPDRAGFMRVDCRKALAEGLRFRPLGQTVTDTLAWDETRSQDLERRAGLRAERERQLLVAIS